ncbi:hypothetical protein GUITHDRAFT_142268 [Guillardia theta CCMP2712]|uniref:Uncharacterized protein n=1 Tax=Guillardia theta (strain CCMP2712) TaxID=905079 RepID=L1IXZ6_GUITC|nr:hypothetical protein GUITHDRAFT_142268 [Guillardia theta CCMP2712]EKX41111.1 hypothetical protein GUITHDRAFT_142268 [Guillardia theta CCMP2712]|eukprot:XP_005828091.1 hypothetical protein GUITHDRAFT_142268 [Guillardia theta CCMP2712]
MTTTWSPQTLITFECRFAEEERQNSFEIFDNCKQDLQRMMARYVQSENDGNVELLCRVKKVWEDLEGCLPSPGDLKSEVELANLFNENVFSLVRKVIEWEEKFYGQWSACNRPDCEKSVEDLFKVLHNKHAAQEDFLDVLKKADDAEEVKFEIAKLVSCDRAFAHFLQILQDRKDQNLSSLDTLNQSLNTISAENPFVKKKEDLRNNAQKMISKWENDKIALESQVQAYQQRLNSLEEMFSAADTQGMHAAKALRSRGAQVEEERRRNLKSLNEVLIKMLKTEVEAEDLRRKEDRGAGILDTISTIQMMRMNSLFRFHDVESTIYMHLDSFVHTATKIQQDVREHRLLADRREVIEPLHASLRETSMQLSECSRRCHEIAGRISRPVTSRRRELHLSYSEEGGSSTGSPSRQEEGKMKFTVTLEGEDILRKPRLHTIQGNISTLEELAIRLGLTTTASMLWETSPQLAMAATDSTMLLLCLQDSEREEVVQRDVEVEEGGWYVFRLRGVSSLTGFVNLGISVVCRKRGSVIVQNSSTFWGGASGWNDPDRVQEGEEEEEDDRVVEEESWGAGVGSPAARVSWSMLADKDEVEVKFESPSNRVHVCIFLNEVRGSLCWAAAEEEGWTQVEENQQVSIQRAELVRLKRMAYKHPRMDCEVQRIEAELKEREKEHLQMQRRIRESMRRKEELEEVIDNLRNSRLSLTNEEHEWEMSDADV